MKTINNLKLYKMQTIIKQPKRNYTYTIKKNEILIFEQIKENENTFNCISQITKQLRKEKYLQVINLIKQ
tara:strand:+ start:581 stop:790 length:210 start_codon:yes stop_codon:yes gene_type:complete